MDNRRLTNGERRVVELVGLALPNKEIGCRLGLTENTIKVYLSRAMLKLGLNNRYEVLVWVRDQGGETLAVEMTAFERVSSLIQANDFTADEKRKIVTLLLGRGAELLVGSLKPAA